MVARVGALALLAALLAAGCASTGVAQSGDVSKEGEQPAADLQAGAQAQTIEQWAAANPNNGAPGSGEGDGK